MAQEETPEAIAKAYIAALNKLAQKRQSETRFNEKLEGAESPWPNKPQHALDLPPKGQGC